MSLVDEILSGLGPIQPIAAKQEQAAPVQNELPAEEGPAIEQDDYEYLRKYGLDPDAIKEPYDPSEHGSILERLYTSSINKPKPVDEKKVRNAQTVAGIGDALGMIAQMWSANKGAHVRERGYNETASAAISGRAQQLRDLYKADSDKYNMGLYAARREDLITKLRSMGANAKEVRAALMAKDRADQAQKNWEAQFEENKRSQKEREKYNRSREERLGGSKDDKVIKVDTAQRTYELTPERASYMRGEMLKRPDLLAERNPSWVIRIPIMEELPDGSKLPTGRYTTRIDYSRIKDDDLVRAYLEMTEEAELEKRRSFTEGLMSKPEPSKEQSEQNYSTGGYY